VCRIEVSFRRSRDFREVLVAAYANFRSIGLLRLRAGICIVRQYIESCTAFRNKQRGQSLTIMGNDSFVVSVHHMLNVDGILRGTGRCLAES
jgi:hypothetical protein